ncbi:MAG TPA: HlyD family efflux transporter periplasmic adaptor subunit [Planctomycetota bacterium]|nr:HlyD family efflux transporter periplasmic adaptor subunit [Planctomycetota bacterium]
MAETETGAVRVVTTPVTDVAHTMKAARLLYSAPGFILRGPIYMIFIITFSGLIYSFYGKVNQIITCRMEVKADYTRIQSPTGGYVTQVYVSEGSEVKPYTNLVDIQFKRGALDDSETVKLQKQKEKIENDLKWANQDRKEQEQRILDLKRSLQEESAKEPALAERIGKEKLEWEAQVTNSLNSIAKIQTTIKNAELGIADLKRNVEAAKVRAQTARKRFEEEKELVDKKQSTILQLRPLQDAKDAAEKAVEDAHSAVLKAEGDLANLQLQLQTAQAEPQRLKNEWDQRTYRHENERNAIRERKSQLQSDINRMQLSLEKGSEQMQKELLEIEEKIKQTGALSQFGVAYENELCRITSTFGGTVTGVNVKAGQQISGGEVLLSLVRNTEAKYCQLFIQNRDVSRVKKGQEVNIKYDAYPYQEWGIFKGTVADIATRPSEEKDKASMYRVQVSLEKQEIVRGKKHIDLTLGLQGFAEIKTGEKRLIETIFTPISKFFLQDE